MRAAKPRNAPRNRFAGLAQKFLNNQAAGGLVMLLFAAMGLVLANSDAREAYEALRVMPLAIGLGDVSASMPFNLFVKDVLMAIFFLLVGMELKREMQEGFLSKPGQKILPLIAALGGIALPALIYLFINRDIPAHLNGWAIPTATDIAFAVCVVSLLGKHVPPAAKIFLLAIAIYDDLAAILIIALFYSKGIALLPLAIAGGVALVMFALNRLRVTRLMLYMLLGGVLWHFIHQAGIHTTVAGMITGLMIPLRPNAHDSESPLNRCIHFLHPWVAFVILPLFALVSAGVDVRGLTLDAIREPLTLGVALGLFLGKQLGVFAATLAAVKLGFATRPDGTSWATLYGIAIVAGIGFTMSLFVGHLAFRAETVHDTIRLGVLAGSLASALVGALVLRLASSRKSQ